MSDLFSAINSAASALRAFQAALDVTQNNVSNSQTPGYVKQVPSFDAVTFQPTKGLDGGVQASTPQDSRNQYAEVAVRQQVSLLGASQQLSTSLDPIERVFSVSSAGSIASSLDALFQSFSAWSANPNDASARAAVLSAAGGVATAFQQSAAQLTQIRSSVDGDLKTTVTSINQIAAQLAAINKARNTSGGPDPGLDAQRNAALEQLAQYADVQVLTNSDGSVNVLLGGQVPLVTGDQVNLLRLSSSNPSSAINPAATPNVAVVDSMGADVSQKITDGQLGALLSVRNQILTHLIGGPTSNGELNVLASQVASSVNGVLTAAGGTALFTSDTASAVDTAATISVSAGLQPSGLVAADPGPPPVSNGVPLKLSALSSTQFTGLQAMTFGQYYGSTASWLGNQLSQAQTASTAQTQTVSQARAQRQQLSGVSLDEEATHLMELQRSYQAASHMVTVIDNLTQSIIDMIH